MKSQVGRIMFSIIIFTKYHHKIKKPIQYLLTAFYVSRLNSLYELIPLFLTTVLQSRDNCYSHFIGEENKAKIFEINFPEV